VLIQQPKNISASATILSLKYFIIF